MGTMELLNVEPLELKFPFELKKQISCSIQLSNKTENHVAFKVKTTNPKKYCVRPNTGVVLPRSTCDVIVTMQAQKEAPPDMQCKDKFLLQSVAAGPGTAPKDITPEMFSKNSGRVVEECKLKVLYLPPPQPPSPVLEEPDEGMSPKVSFTDSTMKDSTVKDSTVKDSTMKDSTNLNSSQSSEAPRQYVDSHDKSSEARSILTKLVEEKNAAVQQSSKIQQEMDLLKRGGNKSQGGGGVSIMVVIAISLIGLVLGYLMKK
ncbi:vesicle-associated protein 1-2-like [Cynara cardunculus var. scolymus]|uniref:vesicle-associated protein 1-2-like n=1 Tax=Cynara cardunculus var. scolymus TaxID=59895 RepID=UPI000D625BEE|nr:vesicle-associated protein 1-2-like [Cynara cardunculus var. scolymus]